MPGYSSEMLPGPPRPSSAAPSAVNRSNDAINIYRNKKKCLHVRDLPAGIRRSWCFFINMPTPGTPPLYFQLPTRIHKKKVAGFCFLVLSIKRERVLQSKCRTSNPFPGPFYCVNSAKILLPFFSAFFAHILVMNHISSYNSAIPIMRWS